MSEKDNADRREYLLLDERDNTLTALKDLAKGAVLVTEEGSRIWFWWKTCPTPTNSPELRFPRTPK